LTGYLLPWDQKGYWATQVATNIAGNIPLLGPFIQKVIVGGPEYGNHTLTHFFALHVAILPGILILLLIGHLTAFRRHGVTTPPDAQGEDKFWPAQAFRDMVMCMVVFAVMLSLVLFTGHGNTIETRQAPETLYERLAHAGKQGLGANLDAPADPATEEYPARPEWYFLFLFQLLKYFEGDQEIIGTLVIPNAVMLLLFLLPLFGYGKMRDFGHFLGIVVVVALLAGVSVLTFLAIADDSAQPLVFGLGGSEKAQDLHKKFRKAEVAAQRAVNLAAYGIPEEGARQLLRADPRTQGPKLFAMNCAGCHRFTAETLPEEYREILMNGKKYQAADLAGFGTEKWLRGLLENPGSDKYFGLTKLEGMKKWRKGIEKERKNMSDKEKAEQDAEFDQLARWLAEQARDKDERQEKASKDAGYGKFLKDTQELFFNAEKHECSSCHTFQGEGGKSAPDLTDYGSQEWIRGMLLAPGHRSRYGARNEMPAFRPPEDVPGGRLLLQEFFESNPDFPRNKVIFLSDLDRELIIRWLTRDERVVFGGKAVSGPPKR
jgi:ubiquinol-cytochrome c reductase cytochrome b subunit